MDRIIENAPSGPVLKMIFKITNETDAIPSSSLPYIVLNNTGTSKIQNASVASCHECQIDILYYFQLPLNSYMDINMFCNL
jgi:hypothetical protein